MSLTKADIVNHLIQKCSLEHKDAALLVDLIFENIRKSLEISEDVKISGFGNFEVRQKKERIGRNPKTKEECTISKRNVVKFKPGQLLIKLINAHNDNTE